MNPQEASLRPLYNNELKAILNQIQTKGGLDYETAVANLVSKYGSAISPQEIGDTLYGIYSDVLGAPQARYYGVAPSSAGGGYAAPQVNLASKISALNDMYNLLYQDLGAMTQEQRGKIEQGFGQQQQASEKSYREVARQLPSQFAARGTASSSDYAMAAGRASDMYDQAIQQIQQEKEQKLADLGKLYQQQMTGLQSAQAQLGSLPKYGTQAEASQLESQLGSLAQQRAGLGTQAGYLGQLNQVAPLPAATPAKLQEQLSNLVASSIPSFAKQQIAGNQIKQAGLPADQQQYYTDYFQKLQQQQGTPSQGA